MLVAHKKAREVAQSLVDQFGAGAEQEAGLRAEALARVGNLEAARIWDELGAAVVRLRRPARRSVKQRRAA